MTKKLQLFIWLACIVLHAQGQTADFTIDRKDLRSYVRILSSNTLEGRGLGTQGHMRTSRFIADQFQELGLDHFDTSGYFQKFNLSASYWGEVYVKTSKNKLENFSSMVFQGHLPLNDEMEMEVVFAGTGTEEEFRRSDSYPFYREGIPSILFFAGMHSDYHKPTDTFQKINFRTLQNRVRQIALVIELLQREGWEN